MLVHVIYVLLTISRVADIEICHMYDDNPVRITHANKKAKDWFMVEQTKVRVQMHSRLINLNF